MKLNLLVVMAVFGFHVQAEGVPPVLASRVVDQQVSASETLDVERNVTQEIFLPERQIMPVVAGVERVESPGLVAGVVTDLSVVPDNKPAPVVIGNLTVYGDGSVSFLMNPGLLKPQLTELLLAHQRVNSVEWLAEKNLMWANQFLVQGESIEHVINDVLKAYSLRADVKKNMVVTVRGINK